MTVPDPVRRATRLGLLGDSQKIYGPIFGLTTATGRKALLYNLGLIISMKKVTISEFKAKCLSLLEEVQKTKKPLLVTKFGKPIAEVNPSSLNQKKPKLARLHERRDQVFGRHRVASIPGERK